VPCHSPTTPLNTLAGLAGPPDELTCSNETRSGDNARSPLSVVDSGEAITLPDTPRARLSTVSVSCSRRGNWHLYPIVILTDLRIPVS
jgi:hypothetical protein